MSTVGQWDIRFLKMAKGIASWSKDPSTKTGAVIIRPDKTVASVGFNGFPRGMSDDNEHYDDRDVKYSKIIHCEMNAIISAKERLTGYILYVYPFISCDRCAVHVIQAGIVQVVAPMTPTHLDTRWGDSIKRSMSYFLEAGVKLGPFYSHSYLE